MRRLHGILAGLVCLTPVVASADVHHIQLNPNAELRPLSTGVQAGIELEQGFSVPGHRWPARIVRLEIPPDGRVESLTLTPRRDVMVDGPVRAADDYPEMDLGRPDGETDGYAYWLLPEGDLRGHRIAHVLLSPFREDAGSVHFLTDFEIDISSSIAETSALSRRMRHPRTDASDDRLLRSLLDSEPREYGVEDIEARSVPPELGTDTVEYVIITTSDMAAAFQTLADYKTREGLPAIVATVEAIESGYDGNDTADRIRSYIRDLYLYQGLRYVLLGGDTGQVSIRIAVNRYQAPSGHEVTTDKYFANLDGNWNADGDELLGEAPDQGAGIPGDLVDLYPEVVVSRIPVRSAAEAQSYVAKWKAYTGYDPVNFRSDYQHRILSLGEVLFPADWAHGDDPGEITVDGAAICESSLIYVPPGFERTRLYENYDAYPGAFPESRDAAIARVNEGYGFIDHVGHGFRNNMSVGEGKLVNADADQFTNTNAYSVLYAVNCTSGAILFDCIIEHIMRNPTGGVINAVSSTDLDYPFVSERFKHEFFRLLFQEDVTTFGDAFQQSDLPFTPTATLSENSFRWTIMTLLATGDPALDMWTNTPGSLDVAFNPTLALGVGSFAVTVTDNGTPIEGARVTLWKNDGYGVGWTNASGMVTIPFLPTTQGQFQVTAVKHDYVPAVGNAQVVAPTTAALRINAVTVHDGDGMGGTGNGDGRPDAGENVVLDLSLRNNGSATATGISATLHASNPFLTVTDSTATSPNIAIGATQTVTGAFAYHVSAALPDTLRHALVPATVTVTSAQGTWQEDWPFSVYQRIIDLVHLDWSIPDDDGDGVLESGETAEVILTLENRGEAEAVNVVGVGAYSGSQFVVLDDTIAFGDIPSGAQIADGPLRLLSVGGGAADLNLTLTVSDTYASSLMVRALDVVSPATPDTMEFVPASSSVRLTWPAPPDADLRGYRVLRAEDPAGPYAVISGDIVDDGSFFVDGGLPSLSSHWYRLLSVDWSGNESAVSDSFRASTSPPVLDGWPVPLPPGESKGSPTFADLNYDGVWELALGWTYPMVFRPNGSDFVDGDNNALTPGIFSTIGDGLSKFWNSPAVANIDRDPVQEIVFCAWNITTGVPGYMYVLDATGAVQAGWPQEIGPQPWSTAAIGDIDGDGLGEIFVSSGASGGRFAGVLHGFHSNGTEILDGDNDPSSNGVFYKSSNPLSRFLYGSPAMADLDGDQLDEIVFLEKASHAPPTQSILHVFNGDRSELPGFPYGAAFLKASTSSPAVADLDDNGDLEIIFVTQDRVSVVNHNGTAFGGWPKTIPELPVTYTDAYDYMSSPAIGDINGDGHLDIAVGWMDGKIYAWTGSGGAPLPNFPVQIPISGGPIDKYLRSPILGNIDGDPRPEIIVSSGADRLYAVRWNGSQVDGFPLQLQGIVFGSAAIWDLNQDGFVNLMVQTNSPMLEVYNFSSVPFQPAEHPWPMFRHNQRKNGLYSDPVVVDVEDPPAAPPPATAALFPAAPNPFTPRVDLPFAVPDGGRPVRIRVFDVNGREVRRLADGSFPAGEFRISWDGRTETGVRLAAGIYFARVEIGRETFVQKLTMLR